MANPNDDVTTNIEANDADVAELKKAHYQENAGQTRIKAPVNELMNVLNPELLNMLKIGKRASQFQGMDRCIRVLEAGTPNQRHCLAMMVKNLTTNQLMCTNCDRVKDPNANPKIINSSMIRLSQKELAECGLDHDPLINAKSEPIPQPKRLKPVKQEETAPRRAKVKTPSKVTIEMSMAELQNDPNVVNVMLKKTLDAIFELPVSNFREAEAIRVVKERVESFLTKGE